jgi:hypothetical protein
MFVPLQWEHSRMTFSRWFHSARRAFVIQTLIEARGNQLVAAEAMQVHRNTLQRFMKEDGITPQMVRAIRARQPERTLTKTTIPYASRAIHRVTERSSNVN